MQRQPIGSFEAIVTALGGTSEFARILDREAPSVCAWRSKGKVPSKFYPVVRAELLKRGYAVPPLGLFSFYVTKRRRKRADAAASSFRCRS